VRPDDLFLELLRELLRWHTPNGGADRAHLVSILTRLIAEIESRDSTAKE